MALTVTSAPSSVSETPAPLAPAAADPVYACQMRGAMAEDRVYGPFGTLDINSAIVRAEVTQACLEQARRGGTILR